MAAVTLDLSYEREGTLTEVRQRVRMNGMNKIRPYDRKIGWQWSRETSHDMYQEDYRYGTFYFLCSALQ